MQENNNFESIIRTWRRLSGEQIETAGVSMSGDSTDSKPPKKKEEEVDLLMLEKSKLPVSTIATAGTAAASFEIPTDSTEKSEEKQEFLKRDATEPKEAAGDANEKAFKSNKDDDYLDNEKVKNKADKPDSEKPGDNVDSVFLKPSQPHKTRSTASTVEQDDCGITCLYYTLQCCECVVM